MEAQIVQKNAKRQPYMKYKSQIVANVRCITYVNISMRLFLV